MAHIVKPRLQLKVSPVDNVNRFCFDPWEEICKCEEVIELGQKKNGRKAECPIGRKMVVAKRIEMVDPFGVHNDFLRSKSLEKTVSKSTWVPEAIS